MISYVCTTISYVKIRYRMSTYDIVGYQESRWSRPGPKAVTVGSCRHEPAAGTSRLVDITDSWYRLVDITDSWYPVSMRLRIEEGIRVTEPCSSASQVTSHQCHRRTQICTGPLNHDSPRLKVRLEMQTTKSVFSKSFAAIS